MSSIDTIDPKNFEAILRTHFTDNSIYLIELKMKKNDVLISDCEAFGMGDHPKIWYPLIGLRIFTQDGKDWKHSRSLLRPLFLSRRVKNFLEISKSVKTLIRCIPEGEIVDFQSLFFRLTLDITTHFLFGRSIKSLVAKNGEAEAFSKSFWIAQEYLAHKGRLGPLHWILNNKEFCDANATVHMWIDAKIREAIILHNSHAESTKTDYGFLGSLMGEK